MTGFNLPPGCEVWHIPGNRPEDQDEEAFWDTLFERAPDDKLPEEWWEDEGIAELVRLARDLGYKKGADDQRLAEDLARAERET